MMNNLPFLALPAILIVLYAAIVTVLVRKYLRTHDVGFVWLGVAVVVWPLLSVGIRVAEIALSRRIQAGQPVVFPSRS